jgi:hypothetical protein
MDVKKFLGSVAIGAASLVAVHGDASAAAGYVCEAHFRHYAGYGNHGYVYVNAYTQPGCAGSWVMGAVYCTTGGTSSTCSPGDLNTAAELQALIQNLQRAAAARQKVELVATSSGSGKWVSFFSN